MVRQEKKIKEKTTKNTRASPLANKTEQGLNMIEPRKVRNERP